MRKVLGALVLAGAFATLVAGCGPAGTTPPVAPSTAPPSSSTASPSSPASPVTGIVVKVDAQSLTDVRGFTLRMLDGRELVFTIGVLQNGTDFPPAHLSEHLATASPVKVTFHLEGTRLVVTRIEDGG